MSRNAVAVVSSALFVVFALLLVMVPVPYVAWRPGQTIDVLASGDSGSPIMIHGASTYETNGKLLMTTVSATRVDSRLSFPEAVFVYLQQDSDAMPRDLIYQPGLSNQQVEEQAVAMMNTSRVNATVAALRAAGIPVTEQPRVDAVVLSGPSAGILEPGDLIGTLDGATVTSQEEVRELIRAKDVGDPVTFQVIRDEEELELVVTTEASATDPSVPVVGIEVGIGFKHDPMVTYGIDQNVTGPSAGLVFALGVYDKLTNGHLLGDRVVAGTGTIDASGNFGSIAGIREKIKGAERDGASVFLLPAANCDEVGDLDTNVQLISVATLSEAIVAMQYLNEGKTSEVPTCG